jgi:hypothetical protein
LLLASFGIFWCQKKGEGRRLFDKRPKTLI